jgi:2-polyprenyl-6-hydroxyphenyl methylase/3-demethylubiquinone-9 3-methyltransferase
MNGERLFYESIADDFDSLMNPYDLQRRLSVVFDELLPHRLVGLRALDLGSGTGWFSEKASRLGASVTSLDISTSLAKITRDRAQSSAVAADALRLPFASGSFDLVVSSEMLEHLARPEKAIAEAARVLAPRGMLVITTPNRPWKWVVDLATRLRLRPYGGYENFLGFDELRRCLQAMGLTIEAHYGFHPWPFQLALLQPLSRLVDRYFGSGRWGRWMLNQAVRARRPQPLLPVTDLEK